MESFASIRLTNGITGSSEILQQSEQMRTISDLKVYLSEQHPTEPKPPSHRFEIWRSSAGKEGNPKRQRTCPAQDPAEPETIQVSAVGDDSTLPCGSPGEIVSYCYVVRAFCDDDFNPGLRDYELDNLDEYSRTELFRCGFFLANDWCANRMDYDPFEVFSQLDGSSILEHKMVMVLVAITDGPYCDGGFVVADTLERLIWEYLDKSGPSFDQFDVAALHTLLLYYSRQGDYEHVLRLASILKGKRGSARLLISILNQKVDAAGEDVFSTPLLKACGSGSVCLVEFLIDSGADAALTLDLNDSPLKCAVCAGDLEMVKLLLRCDGIDVVAMLDIARSRLYENETDCNPTRDLAIYEALLEQVPKELMTEDVAEDWRAIQSPEGRAGLLRAGARAGQVALHEWLFFRRMAEDSEDE